MVDRLTCAENKLTPAADNSGNILRVCYEIACVFLLLPLFREQRKNSFPLRFILYALKTTDVIPHIVASNTGHPDSRRLERERHPFTTEEVDRVLWRAGDVACGATDQSFERRALLLGC